MHHQTTRCAQIGSKLIRRAIVWKVLAWVISSLILTQLADGLSAYALSLGGAGWFLVIPADLLLRWIIITGSLVYLIHRWIAAFAPTLYILTLRNTKLDVSSVYCSFSPFSQATIRELAEQLCQEDCQRWGKERLWEEGEDGERIAYRPYTAEIHITSGAFLLACWQQQFARLP